MDVCEDIAIAQGDLRLSSVGFLLLLASIDCAAVTVYSPLKQRILINNTVGYTWDANAHY